MLLVGKSTKFLWPCSIAMLVHQRVYMFIHVYTCLYLFIPLMVIRCDNWGMVYCCFSYVFHGENPWFPNVSRRFSSAETCSGGLQRPRPRHGHGLLRELNGRPGALRGARGCERRPLRAMGRPWRFWKYG